MANNVQNTSPTLFLALASLWPTKQISEIRQVKKKEANWDIKIRLFHALQLVASLITVIATPIILLSAVLEAAFRVATCQFSKAMETVMLPPACLLFNASFIPASLIGMLTNDNCAIKTQQGMEWCGNTIVNVLTCNGLCVEE